MGTRKVSSYIVLLRVVIPCAFDPSTCCTESTACCEFQQDSSSELQGLARGNALYSSAACELSCNPSWNLRACNVALGRNSKPGVNGTSKRRLSLLRSLRPGIGNVAEP
mmetsp:Transcript_19920/g.42398  ORF Transcript_19920/g.42398 Transcript_19920/m.42398 type:complete len:109 (+) Transcript_19920:33-359(+)